MNSWIGGSLSSLKGQLTHLITEGTEEVSDPKGELIIAKQKINELENQVRSLTSDVKDLNDKNNEYKIKLQSEEMLLQNVSDSYKEKLKQKEENIESLRDELSSCKMDLGNSSSFIRQSDTFLRQNDEWPSEFCDFVNQSSAETAFSRSGVNEADSLRHRIGELNQEVLRWRTIAESAQSHQQENSIGDSTESSLAKLLEIQRQDLELQHSNYIMELQHEHNKQLGFLKRISHERTRSSENDDYETFSTHISEYNNAVCASMVPDSSTKVDVIECGIQTAYWDTESKECQVTMTAPEQEHSDTNAGGEDNVYSSSCDIGCQCSIIIDTGLSSDHSMLDNASSYRLPQASGHNIGDSMSQVSDISEVSIKSRLLEEHVRHLSDRIEEYGHQLTSIDDVMLTSSSMHDNDDHDDHLTNKIHNLKIKLSQRKNVIIETNNLYPNVESAGNEVITCTDSWEDSSENSLVQESNMDLKQKMELETRINDMYHIIFSHYPSNGDNILDTVGSIKDAIVDLRHGIIERDDTLNNDLRSLYKEIVSSDIDSEVNLVDGIRERFSNMRVTMEGLVDRVVVDDIMSTYGREKAVLEEEIVELVRKNGEYAEKLEDLSSTITRYESLEKVCDNYERELLELKGSSTKTDLCMDSEDILEHVKSFNEEKDECIEKLESRIISLQNLCEEKDDFIKAMKARETEIIYEYDCSIDVLNSELDSVRATVEKSYETEIDCMKQIHRINVSLREKDEMINSLNEELTMLSHQSTDDDIVPLGRSENIESWSQTEIGYEEDQKKLHDHIEVLSVENKRLEEVIEAQANSLGQYEARVNSQDAEIVRLSRRRDSTNGSSHPESVLSSEEMTKETLQHLSQMIRDKEWEIDALKSKNDSLCAIIKESSEPNDGDIVGPIEKLLNEKELLSKEVLWYQENREQLVNALNLKHKESLNYHGEIQRLVAFINVEQMKWNYLTSENEHLKEEVRGFTEEKSRKYLVDVGVDFRDDLPSYNECMEVGNCDQCKSLKERVTNLEMENRQSFGEIRRVEKQLEQVSFELEESRLQFNELLSSHDRCQSQMSHYQEELAKWCKTDVVDAAKDIWNETTEAESTDPSVMISEETPIDVGDPLRMYQLQCVDHIHQIDQLRAKEMKLLKEKQIFQEHLIRIEESYTQDATMAEDREQSLRSQLRATEDQLSVAQEQVVNLEKKLSHLRDNFVAETSGVRQERDESVRRLVETEGRLMDTVSSLNNLQTVLDKFQQEQALELNFQKERLQQELRSLRQDRDLWQSRCDQLQGSVDAQNDIVEAAQRLTDQMEHKDDQLAEMQATMTRKEELIENLKMEIRKLNSVTESKVDKVLMRNLIIGYFHTPVSKRQDALRVIGSLLQFSDQDYHQIGVDTGNKSRWFSWMRSTVDTESKDYDDNIKEHSFSELFVRFLERESAPLSQLRLPTNQIAAEARRHSSLSQSDDFYYVNTVSSSQAPPSITDHHKFFTSSPLVTKRTAGSSDNTGDDPVQRDTPPLFISTLQEPKCPANDQSKSPSVAQSLSGSHRRTDSNRNALLSLLDQ